MTEPVDFDRARAAAELRSAGECSVHCSECEGSAHHWMPDGVGPDDEMPADPARSVWVGCKHCDIRLYSPDAYDMTLG